MLQRNLTLEVKTVSGNQFTGYGSVFGNVDYGGDVVLPGAFRKTLKKHRDEGTMPAMFWMHKADEVPGAWIDMKEDKGGLYVHGEVLDTTLGRDVKILLEKKAVRGLSIGYRPVETDWRDDGVRLLKEVDLFEVSIVSLAMNPLAKIEAMKARLSQEGEYVPSEREFEQLLRRAGCSQRVSRALIAKMFDGEGVADGTFASSHWDGGAEDDEAKQIAEALESLNGSMFAASLKRVF